MPDGLEHRAPGRDCSGRWLCGQGDQSRDRRRTRRDREENCVATTTILLFVAAYPDVLLCKLLGNRAPASAYGYENIIFIQVLTLGILCGKTDNSNEVSHKLIKGECN